MVSEIRMYVEGGGDRQEGKAQIRQGFGQFFNNALSKRIKVIACGSRNSAYRDFKNALEDHPKAFNILLVDSEEAVKGVSQRHHLHQVVLHK